MGVTNPSAVGQHKMDFVLFVGFVLLGFFCLFVLIFLLSFLREKEHKIGWILRKGGSRGSWGGESI